MLNIVKVFETFYFLPTALLKYKSKIGLNCIFCHQNIFLNAKPPSTHLLPSRRCSPVVKFNIYGHSQLRITRVKLS